MTLKRRYNDFLLLQYSTQTLIFFLDTIVVTTTKLDFCSIQFLPEHSFIQFVQSKKFSSFFLNLGSIHYIFTLNNQFDFRSIFTARWTFFDIDSFLIDCDLGKEPAPFAPMGLQCSYVFT